MDDFAAVAAQLKKEPQAAFTVKRRCQAGYPIISENACRTSDNQPFPTLYWLTCPKLSRAIGVLESEGGVADFERMLSESEQLRHQLALSERDYRRRRAELGEGKTELISGIGGNRDSEHLKCLHAHTADFLASGLNPIGSLIISKVGYPVDCRLCDDLCG